jgi:hypothetical protein
MPHSPVPERKKWEADADAEEGVGI